MAIFYLNFSNGTVGKGLAHFNYITASEKYSYKKNELLHSINNMPKNINARDFWLEADVRERENGRVYKEIRLSLPQELSLDDNKKLLENFLKEELKEKFYYTAVIHDKEALNKNDKNIHAHVMICPREIDGIDRPLKNFFKRYNPKNPQKGGAKKSEYWNKRETLLHFRNSWEILLNKELDKNGVHRVSAKSLLEQKIQALKNGDTELAKTLDRDAIGIKESLSYVLYKDKNVLKEFELLELENYKLNKRLRDSILYLNELVKIRDLEVKEKQENENKLKELSQKLLKDNKQVLIGKKEDVQFANIFEIQENILMLNCEKVFIENKNKSNEFKDEESKYKLLNINLQIDYQTNLLNQEINKLIDNNKTENISTLFVEKTFKKDFLELINIQSSVERLQTQVNKMQIQLENPKEIVANYYSKNALNKIDLKIASLRKVYESAISKRNYEKEIEISTEIEKLKEQKIKIIKDCYNKYPKSKSMEKILKNKIQSSLDKKSLELNKLKVRETLLHQKLTVYADKDKILYLETLKQNLTKKMQFYSNKKEALNIKLEFMKSELGKTHTRALNKISNNEYSKLIKEASELNKEIKEYETKRDKNLFGNLFTSSSHKENLKRYADISLKINKIISKKEEYKEVKSVLENKLIYEINKMNAVINRADSQSRGAYSSIKTINKSLNNLNKTLHSTSGHSANNLNNFINIHNKNLGEVLTTGGLRIKTDFEESLEKQMAREMDFICRG